MPTTLKGLIGNQKKIARTLWDTFGNNPRNAETVDAMKGMLGIIPGGPGDAVSGLLAADDFRRGDTVSGLLNGVGVLPYVPALGGIMKGKGDDIAKVVGKIKAPYDDALEAARIDAWKNHGLPENNTAMDRAKAAGFVNQAYHATTEDFPKFDLQYAGRGTTLTPTEKAVFSSDRPSVANEYVAGPYFKGENGKVERYYQSGANIKPLMLKADNPAFWEMYGRGYEPGFIASAIKDAKKSGEDTVVFEGMRDPGYSTLGQGEKSNIVASLKPKNIRSRFAAFNLSKLNSPDLLASLSGLSLAGLLGSSLYDKRTTD